MLSSLTKVRTVGKTPRLTTCPTPDHNTSASSIEPISAFEKRKMLLEEKQTGKYASKTSCLRLKTVLIAEDQEESDGDEDVSEPIARKINFDTESMEANVTAIEGTNHPEYIRQITEILDLYDRREEQSAEAHSKKLKADYKETIKIDELLQQMEKMIVPALDKLARDPVRIHEIIKREPGANGVQCQVEDQQRLVEAFTSLSQDCQELQELSSFSFDFANEMNTLENATDQLDVKFSSKAAEKLKQTKLKKLLADITSSEH